MDKKNLMHAPNNILIRTQVVEVEVKRLDLCHRNCGIRKV